MFYNALYWHAPHQASKIQVKEKIFSAELTLQITHDVMDTRRSNTPCNWLKLWHDQQRITGQILCYTSSNSRPFLARKLKAEHDKNRSRVLHVIVCVCPQIQRNFAFRTPIYWLLWVPKSCNLFRWTSHGINSAGNGTCFWQVFFCHDVQQHVAPIGYA